ncbi:imidazole glycerol phosphate synthase subunit HisH [Candidatus Omnitrophota bacterium]
MIAIVDYGTGNLRSVQKALESVGADAKVTSDAEEIRTAKKLVLPGVGAFGQAMRKLSEVQLVPVIKDYLESKRPFLGICLGLQLLFTESEECPGLKGLDVFPGIVKRFTELKVPHMGWNQIKITKEKKDNPIFKGLKDDTHAYFCHSFYVEPKDSSIVATRTDYGLDFVSMIAADTIWAMQFHPEKSQAAGLRILKNFVEVS